MKTFLRQIEILLTIVCLVMIGMMVDKLRKANEPGDALPPVNISQLNEATREAGRIVQSGSTSDLERQMRHQGLIE